VSPVVIAYTVHVDWDATDWTATPDFSEAIDDITNYVKSHYIDRGKNQEQGNNQAGTLDVVLYNTDKRFSPAYADGPLFGKIRPWLPVRVQAAIDGGGALTIYTGFISRIRVNPDLNVQEAYLYCTDGMDLLARNMVSQDKTDTTKMNDGEAIGSVLSATGWPEDKRAIDIDGSSIIKYPTTVEF